MKKKQLPRVFHYTFPYVRFHERHYPLIPITLRYQKKVVNTFALLDSGASISVFRPEIAKALGLGRRKGDKMHLGTAKGGLDIDIFKVNVQVEKTKFSSRMGFSKHGAASFNIIGREGFFHKFNVCFNEMLRNVILVPHKRGSK